MSKSSKLVLGALSVMHSMSFGFLHICSPLFVMFSYVSQSLPAVLLSTSNHFVHSHVSSHIVVEGIPVVPSVVARDNIGLPVDGVVTTVVVLSVEDNGVVCVGVVLFVVVV